MLAGSSLPFSGELPRTGLVLSSCNLKISLDRRRPLPVDLGVRTLHDVLGDSKRLSLLIVGALGPKLLESMTTVPGTRRD